MKLVATYGDIEGFGSACRAHPRTVETGPCQIPHRHATVYGFDQRPELMPGEL
jgi:hypothetical protein